VRSRGYTRGERRWSACRCRCRTARRGCRRRGCNGAWMLTKPSAYPGPQSRLFRTRATSSSIYVSAVTVLFVIALKDGEKRDVWFTSIRRARHGSAPRRAKFVKYSGCGVKSACGSSIARPSDARRSCSACPEKVADHDRGVTARGGVERVHGLEGLDVGVQVRERLGRAWLKRLHVISVGGVERVASSPKRWPMPRLRCF
jgi:hypothetical protein